jgi:hypothetical protein
MFEHPPQVLQELQGGGGGSCCPMALLSVMSDRQNPPASSERVRCTETSSVFILAQSVLDPQIGLGEGKLF